MPIGLLIMFGLVGSCTLVALLPIRRPRSLAMLTYGLSVVVNELPQLAAALLAASTALAVAQGDLHGSDAAIAGTLCVLIAAGIVVLATRGFRARAVVDAALRTGLPDTAGPGPAGPRPWTDTVRIQLTPVPLRGRNVARVANLPYGEDRRHRLDVYHRRSRPDGAPVLVYFHGGGYFSGDKHREARLLLHSFAARGWVCVSANYRLRPAAGFPDHLVDAKRVIAWARANVSAYGGDAATVVAAGSSAGGHLVSLAALSANDPAFQPGFESADTGITAAICLYGYLGSYYGSDEHESLPSTPLGYDAAAAPPFFLAHGTNDTYVPVAMARAMVRHLRAGSTQPVVYAELPGAQHGFDLLRSLRFQAVLDGAEAFTDRVLASRTPAVRGSADPAERAGLQTVWRVAG